MGLISVTSAQFWDKTEAARNSLCLAATFSHRLGTCVRKKNSKIILLTKKKHPYKQTKNNKKQNIILFVIFSRAGIKGEKRIHFWVSKLRNIITC